MITHHIKMTSLVIDNNSCKYTANLLHTKSIFGKVISTNNVTVGGFGTRSGVVVKETDGVISDKPVCRKMVLKAVEEQHKVFI